MPRAGPKRVQRYSLEFKRAAVRLSQLAGVEVQAVAPVFDGQSEGDDAPQVREPLDSGGPQ